MLAIMAMFGGISIPLQALPPTLQHVARFTPMFGVGQIAKAPIAGVVTAWAIGAVMCWTVVFGAGAMAMFRRDTARV